MDDEARVGEALTKTIVCALKSSPSLDNNDRWLNPTEVFTPACTNTDTKDFYFYAVHFLFLKKKKINFHKHFKH